MIPHEVFLTPGAIHSLRSEGVLVSRPGPYAVDPRSGSCTCEAGKGDDHSDLCDRWFFLVDIDGRSARLDRTQVLEIVP